MSVGPTSPEVDCSGPGVGETTIQTDGLLQHHRRWQFHPWAGDVWVPKRVASRGSSLGTTPG